MARPVASLCVFLGLVGAVGSRAQTVYGTVRGTISTASGAPASGIPVVLVGTAFTAVSDGHGEFQITDVPAGRYTIGVPSAEVVEEFPVRITAASVTGIDVVLGTGEHPRRPSLLPPPVARDPESGRFSVPGELLEGLPIDEPRQSLTLLPGVVLRHDDIGIGSASGGSVRGAGPGDAGVYIDGAPVRFETLGTQGVSLGANAIQEIGLTPGVAWVEAGDARGGVLSYVTRSGGPRFGARFRAGTDEPFGAGSSVGYNRFEGSLGGPLPGVTRLTWFVSAALLGQSSPYLGRGAADQPTYVLGGVDTTVQWIDGSGQPVSAALPRFVQSSGRCDATLNAGFDCRGLRRPLAWATERAEQGKLLYSYGAGSSVSLTGVASDVERRFYPGSDIADPALYGGARAWSRLAVLNLAQRLPVVGGGPLMLKVNLSVGIDRQVSGALDPRSELATRDPALGVELRTLRFTGADSMPFPLTERIVRNVRSNTGLRVPFLNRTDLRNVQPFRLNPYGLASGWPTQGVDARLSMVWERRLNGRMVLEWRHGVQALSLGADLERTESSLFDADLLTEVGLDAFRVHPHRVGLFAGNRVSLRGVTIDLGARYDRISPGGAFPTVPGRIFTNPAWNPAAATDDSAYVNSVARVFTTATTRSLFSPRLRLTVDLPARSVLRLAIGQHVEPLDWGRLFAHSNADLGFTPSLGSVFGRDVRVVKATEMEVAAGHSFGAGLSLDATVHHRDPVIPYGIKFEGFEDPSNPGRTLTVFVPTPIRGSVTGIDSRMAWTRGAVLRAAVSYSVARVSSVDLGHPTAQAWTALAEAAVPVSWKPGAIIGTALHGSSLAAVLRLTSGLPYTRDVGADPGAVISDFPTTAVVGSIGPVNTTRLPWTKSLDLRVSRRLPAGWGIATVYADVRNVFGFTNIVGGYVATDGTVSDLYRESLLSPELSNLQSEASANGALLSGGDVDLRGCAAWSTPINCVALERVERRFGNGDGVYSTPEQTRTLNAYYDAFFGPWRFRGAGRTLRAGVEWTF